MGSLQPGDPEYRAFVGPFEQYDVMGATQFALLFALGIRQHHRLLDVGCGSLRAGRLFIVYLDPDRYVGIEPNGWLIDEAVRNQLGEDILRIKRPHFVSTESFDISGLGTFDFVVAQSIASHTGPRLVRRLLSAVHEAVGEQGLAAVTFIHAEPSDQNVVHIGPSDEVDDWLYPYCYSYEREAVEEFLGEADLCGYPIGWYHPRQTWWLLGRNPDALPPARFSEHLDGLTLAEGFEGSLRAVDLPR